MKPKPSMMPLIGLLFVFNIENVCDEKREEVIVSKNINIDSELSELFDVLLKSEFLRYPPGAQDKYIEIINYYLKVGGSFDDLFEDMDTYFDQSIHDQRHFMEVLLSCLKCYQSENAPES
ncbi:hypothetical protein [Pseudomonas sp. FP2300]|uniref:hypothetical protein n=1 Tax=Pseudomonas sp. FP2300 TaxID=2954090 RepID=UPI002736ACE5|nr:hypothetical protein [Pseudomonas sp. FP2300]WLH61518.1 hypothetical protein PSH86_22755 [Pseudomonas sp. FP2300]